jgi:pyridoxal phosphate enzyme (YggS family)
VQAVSDVNVRITENLARVRDQIAAAVRESGRPADSVRLVAVTKYVGLTEIQALVKAGCQDLGEARPQDLWAKAPQVSGVRWHLIGHLQRNKVARTLPLVALVHSVDSERLLAAVHDAAKEQNLRVPVLLEVNVSREEAKHGFTPEELDQLLAKLAQFDAVQVRGLMCMAGLEGDGDHARREFASLRELRDRLQTNCPPGVMLEELSMGMSGDFQAAILEGATMVRIGSALFEEISQADA